MVRFFFIGLGEFLTFAATVLTILVNMGQLTENVVARHFYFARLETTGLGNTLSSGNAGSLYASNQAAAEQMNQGLKYNYYWGMYSFCGGAGTDKNRDCSDRYVGYRWEPTTVLVQDAPTTYSSQLQNLFNTSNGSFKNVSYLSTLSRVANVIILVGTILTGLAFLTGFLAHRFCFAFAALECLGAAGCLGVGAALWTAILYKARNSIPDNSGIVIDYGNSLWMTWGAFVAVVVAIVPLIIGCCLGRSKY